MLENPGDELYFGEVYRTILQEAWLPEGGELCQRTGISRRGRRPTQQGPGASSPSPSQAQIRQGFSACVAAWNALPWDTPNAPPCDTRRGKDSWKQEKDERGLMCGYFDVFMKDCLAHYNATGCIPPTAYKITPSPPSLLDIICYSEHNLTFPNACGSVSKIEGPGTFAASVWKADLCGDTGLLGFQDANGANGCVPYAYHPVHACNGPTWPPTNPELINKNETKTVSLSGGISPFNWTISGNDFSLGSAQTSGRSNSVKAGPAACGGASITIIDACDQRTSGYIRCIDGQWIDTGGYICIAPCNPADKAGCGFAGFSCIAGLFRYCQIFCPSPCHVHCPQEICDECGPTYYGIQYWEC